MATRYVGQPIRRVEDLRLITACARGFNRSSGIGTLEAEALDEALLAIAQAVRIDPEAYARAIDDARDW